MAKINLIFSGDLIPEDEISMCDIGTGSNNPGLSKKKNELIDQQIHETDRRNIGTCLPKAPYRECLKKKIMNSMSDL